MSASIMLQANQITAELERQGILDSAVTWSVTHYAFTVATTGAIAGAGTMGVTISGLYVRLFYCDNWARAMATVPWETNIIGGTTGANVMPAMPIAAAGTYGLADIYYILNAVIASNNPDMRGMVYALLDGNPRTARPSITGTQLMLFIESVRQAAIAGGWVTTTAGGGVPGMFWNDLTHTAVSTTTVVPGGENATVHFDFFSTREEARLKYNNGVRITNAGALVLEWQRNATRLVNLSSVGADPSFNTYVVVHGHPIGLARGLRLLQELGVAIDSSIIPTQEVRVNNIPSEVEGLTVANRTGVNAVNNLTLNEFNNVYIAEQLIFNFTTPVGFMANITIQSGTGAVTVATAATFMGVVDGRNVWQAVVRMPNAAGNVAIGSMPQLTYSIALTYVRHFITQSTTSGVESFSVTTAGNAIGADIAFNTLLRVEWEIANDIDYSFLYINGVRASHAIDNGVFYFEFTPTNNTSISVVAFRDGDAAWRNRANDIASFLTSHGFAPSFTFTDDYIFVSAHGFLLGEAVSSTNAPFGVRVYRTNALAAATTFGMLHNGAYRAFGTAHGLWVWNEFFNDNLTLAVLDNTHYDQAQAIINYLNTNHRFNVSITTHLDHVIIIQTAPSFMFGGFSASITIHVYANNTAASRLFRMHPMVMGYVPIRDGNVVFAGTPHLRSVLAGFLSTDPNSNVAPVVLSQAQIDFITDLNQDMYSNHFGVNSFTVFADFAIINAAAWRMMHPNNNAFHNWLREVRSHVAIFATEQAATVWSNAIPATGQVFTGGGEISTHIEQFGNVVVWGNAAAVGLIVELMHELDTDMFTADEFMVTLPDMDLFAGENITFTAWTTGRELINISGVAPFYRHVRDIPIVCGDYVPVGTVIELRWFISRLDRPQGAVLANGVELTNDVLNPLLNPRNRRSWVVVTEDVVLNFAADFIQHTFTIINDTDVVVEFHVLDFEDEETGRYYYEDGATFTMPHVHGMVIRWIALPTQYVTIYATTAAGARSRFAGTMGSSAGYWIANTSLTFEIVIGFELPETAEFEFMQFRTAATAAGTAMTARQPQDFRNWYADRLALAGIATGAGINLNGWINAHIAYASSPLATYADDTLVSVRGRLADMVTEDYMATTISIDDGEIAFNQVMRSFGAPPTGWPVANAHGQQAANATGVRPAQETEYSRHGFLTAPLIGHALGVDLELYHFFFANRALNDGTSEDGIQVPALIFNRMTGVLSILNNFPGVGWFYIIDFALVNSANERQEFPELEFEFGHYHNVDGVQAIKDNFSVLGRASREQFEPDHRAMMARIQASTINDANAVLLRDYMDALVEYEDMTEAEAVAYTTEQILNFYESFTFETREGAMGRQIRAVGDHAYEGWFNFFTGSGATVGNMTSGSITTAMLASQVLRVPMPGTTDYVTIASLGAGTALANNPTGLMFMTIGGVQHIVFQLETPLNIAQAGVNGFPWGSRIRFQVRFRNAAYTYEDTLPSSVVETYYFSHFSPHRFFTELTAPMNHFTVLERIAFALENVYLADASFRLDMAAFGASLGITSAEARYVTATRVLEFVSTLAFHRNRGKIHATWQQSWTEQTNFTTRQHNYSLSWGIVSNFYIVTPATFWTDLRTAPIIAHQSFGDDGLISMEQGNARYFNGVMEVDLFVYGIAITTMVFTV